MSTFLGFIEEIPGITIDCFEENNLNSSIFFLSHCHSDHMKGLTHKFFNHLLQENKFLYCSHLTKLILQSTFNLNTNFNKHIKVLSLDDSIIINYVYDNIDSSITVCSISSGHCPGSVMFLYTFKNKTILYTGDFRIHINDFKKLKSLHCDNRQLIPLSIDKIYLDTTFLSVDYRTFPSRLDSLRELCLIVKDWIEKDPRNIIVLEISALYGSEFVYIELSKFLNKKIHVQDKVFKIYKQIEILANCVTDISNSTPIHACMNKVECLKNKIGLGCRTEINDKQILTIVLSAAKWIKKNTSSIIEWDSKRKQTKNICYSTHASYEELNAFLKYFKPKKVFPCVCKKNDEKKIYNILDTILQENECSQDCSKRMKLDISKHTAINSVFKSTVISDDDDF